MADQTVQRQSTALGGAVIEIGLTAKPVTAWGGMAIFAAFAESVGLRTLADRALHGLVRTSSNALPASDLLPGFTVGVLTGATRMLHFERLRADSALRTLFGIRRFVAPTTYARFFQALRGECQTHFWETVTAWTLDRLPARPEGYTLDIDSTVVERHGEQDGALCGYTPRRRGGHPGFSRAENHLQPLHHTRLVAPAPASTDAVHAA